MKRLSQIDLVGEWSKCYTCVWCGTIWKVWASDIQHRIDKTTRYSGLGDYDIIKSDVFFVKCECGKEIKLPETDMVFSMRQAIKERGLFPEETIPAKALAVDAPSPEDWQRIGEGVWKLLTFWGDPREARAIKALDYMCAHLQREPPPRKKARTSTTNESATMTHDKFMENPGAAIDLARKIGSSVQIIDKDGERHAFVCIPKALNISELPAGSVPCFEADVNPPLMSGGWFSRALDYLRGLC